MLDETAVGVGGVVNDFAELSTFTRNDLEADEVKVERENVAYAHDVVGGD